MGSVGVLGDVLDAHRRFGQLPPKFRPLAKPNKKANNNYQYI